MAGTADAAKNALESLFNKTKEVVHTAAETTKGYANVAIGKIMPGQQNNTQPADAGMSGASGAAAATATGASDASVPTGGVQ